MSSYLQFARRKARYLKEFLKEEFVVDGYIKPKAKRGIRNNESPMREQEEKEGV